MNVAVWIKAFRLRTLPLALSSVGMGAFIAAWRGYFDLTILTLCISTTIFLQILSNLANDLGDSIHGADHAQRAGPQRAVQSGAISKKAMKTALIIFVVLSLASGLSMLLYAFSNDISSLISLLVLGILSILAAMTYTIGKKPYGYAGLGDFSVLIFFGFVGVMGSYYLFAKSISLDLILPSLTSGLLAVAVLNVNNIRDIESDRVAGKKSIPVRIGKSKAIKYHWSLLILAVLSTLTFSLIHYTAYVQFIYVVLIPVIFMIGNRVSKAEQIDPYLKQTALSSFLFMILFGLGLLLA
ncbi:MAG TPA: 1,4-dihydroxy-2-naphthoate polyprenyltransferase [Cyclobacteriaceae bacterium]|nr:1,4-dihydroxy-2-naphthoate polyprenyltransferase [Cyclobacteriaceae bacterium]